MVVLWRQHQVVESMVIEISQSLWYKTKYLSCLYVCNVYFFLKIHSPNRWTCWSHSGCTQMLGIDKLSPGNLVGWIHHDHIIGFDGWFLFWLAELNMVLSYIFADGIMLSTDESTHCTGTHWHALQGQATMSMQCSSLCQYMSMNPCT